MPMPINLSDLNKILQAISECSGIRCGECCAKYQTGSYCPMTTARYESVAKAAHEAIDNYINLSKPRVEVDEVEFLSLLFTNGDFQ